MKKILIYFLLVFCTLSYLQSYAQGKEAYVWYFGHFVGVDFKTGSPPEVATSAMEAHAVFPSSIADTNGDLLFYSNGRHIWNNNHTYMQNGESIGGSGDKSSLIIPKPGSDYLYYFFSYQTQGYTQQSDFVYSLIDMNLDNGLGGVVVGHKNIYLFSEANRGCLTAVQHANDNDVWVVAHDWLSTHTSNNYYAFLVTSDSVNRTPIGSYTEMPISGLSAFIKISPDGKKIVGISPDDDAYFDLLDFDDETGIVSDSNHLLHYMSQAHKAEFSPNNSKLYICGDNLFQYDLNAGTHEDIINSETLIYEGGGAIQIAPDAKIYQIKNGDFLNVINSPNEQGTACEYEEEVVSFEGLHYLYFASGNFPIFIQSFFDDPTFTTQYHCLGDATTFEIDDTDGIDSVYWKFDDFLNMPHDTSTLFNPVYTFSHAGIYNVELTVYIGLIEKLIKQEVVIHPIPEPDLGNDTLFCDTSFSITLYANCEGDFFTWSTGQFGVSEITVSDTGMYWVNVNKDGCYNRDTIYIGLYPVLQIDSVQYTNDYCLQALAGLNIFVQGGGTGEISYSIDGGNTYYQNGGVFINLPAGTFYVMIKDENDCEGIYENNPVIIQNIGAPEITSIITVHENNYNQDGQIQLEATVPEGSIYYSINNGISFQQDNGLFAGLSAGTYHCVVEDAFGCDTTFDVIINRVFTTTLEAIAGNGNTCIGNAVVSPLLLNNFNEVKSFQVKLTYDSTLVKCEGYINLNPELQEGFSANLIPDAGEIYLNWEGESPLSLPENSTMTELVFTALQDGASAVNWSTGQGESVFLNQYAEQINVTYVTGTLRIYTNPEIQSMPNQKYCEGDTITIDPSIEGGNGEKYYIWTGPAGFVSNDSILYQINIQITQAGTYTLKVSDSLQCEDQKSFQITVNPNPVIAFSDYETLYVEPGYELNAGEGYQSYLWNTGAQTEYILIDSIGEYYVQVYSYNGCKSSDTIQILWGGEAFYMPNAFTPNGDGLNDVFAPVPRYDYVKNYQISIYNRWGELIFQSKELNHGWDGIYKGKPAMTGTYVYRIDYTQAGQTGESKTVTGTVVLIR